MWEKYTLVRDTKFSHQVIPNSFFGEIELLKNCKRLHTAVCEQDSQVLILNKRDFFNRIFLIILVIDSLVLDPEDLSKAKFVSKDSLLEDLDRMKKNVIDKENEKKKMVKLFR